MVVRSLNRGVGGGQETAAASSGTNAARINTALGSFTIPFSFSYPADPVTTTSATVTPATFAANNVNGREITLSAGSYGSLSIGGSDKDIIIQSGVTISSLSITSGSRIRVRGASPRVGTINALTMAEFGSGPSDVLIDGVNMTGGVARVYIGGTRAAIINSTLDVGTGTYAASGFNGPWQNVLLANNNMITPGSADASVRFNSGGTLVFVGNRVTQTSPAFNTFRVHATDGNAVAYIAGNQFEGTRLSLSDSCCGTGDTGFRLTNIWFEDNDFYMSASNSVFINSHFNVTAWDRIGYLSLQRNNGYGPTTTWIGGSPWSGYGYDIADNTTQAYTTPPAWSFI